MLWDGRKNEGGAELEKSLVLLFCYRLVDHSRV